MKAGVEIIAEAAVQINPGTFFRIDLTLNHQLLPHLTGEDKYAFSGLVLRGRRVAASGRFKEYGTPGNLLGLGLWEAEKTKTGEVPDLLSARTRLILSTDLIADRDSFEAFFGLKFITGKAELLLDLPLSSPVLEVVELQPGKYEVDLTELLRERADKLQSLS